MRSIVISLLALLAAACASSRVPDPVFVELRKDGALFVGDKPTSLERLEADLARALAGRPPGAKRVYVRAAPDVVYGDFMGVMNRLQDLDYLSVAIVGGESE